MITLLSLERASRRNIFYAATPKISVHDSTPFIQNLRLLFNDSGFYLIKIGLIYIHSAVLALLLVIRVLSRLRCNGFSALKGYGLPTFFVHNPLIEIPVGAGHTVVG